MTNVNSSMITIARAVVNKYGKKPQTNLRAIDNLRWALEQHEHAVRNNLPTTTIMLYFTEVYDFSKRVIEEWHEGVFGEGCTLLPMLEGALDGVTVLDRSELVCPLHQVQLPCPTCLKSAIELLAAQGLGWPLSE